MNPGVIRAGDMFALDCDPDNPVVALTDAQPVPTRDIVAHLRDRDWWSLEIQWLNGIPEGLSRGTGWGQHSTNRDSWLLSTTDGFQLLNGGPR